jgi:hypothetical protein
MNEIPQRLPMPSVHDTSLWQIRVKPGRGCDIVFSLMRKWIDVELSRPLSILSAFRCDSLPGVIYVETWSAKLSVSTSIKTYYSGIVALTGYVNRSYHHILPVLASKYPP